MDAWSRTGIQHKAWLHLLERWRERLLADDQALAELKLSYPALQDLHHLRTLVRNAREEKRMDKPPRSYRALFHELRQIIPEESPGREADGAHEWESIKT
jgi:ribosome-associated protein